MPTRRSPALWHAAAKGTGEKHSRRSDRDSNHRSHVRRYRIPDNALLLRGAKHGLCRRRTSGAPFTCHARLARWQSLSAARPNSPRSGVTERSRLVCSCDKSRSGRKPRQVALCNSRPTTFRDFRFITESLRFEPAARRRHSCGRTASENNQACPVRCHGAWSRIPALSGLVVCTSQTVARQRSAADLLRRPPHAASAGLRSLVNNLDFFSHHAL